MIGAFEAAQPSVGIFWLVAMPDGQARLLATGCSLDGAEAYGDFLTFADGHYEVWECWRRTRSRDAELSGLVRNFEYEYWPRGRIVFDRENNSFTLYADRKLMRDDVLAAIRRKFCISEQPTSTKSDFHYQSSWDAAAARAINVS